MMPPTLAAAILRLAAIQPPSADLQKRAEELYENIRYWVSCDMPSPAFTQSVSAIADALAAAEAAGREQAFKSAICACQNVRRSHDGQSLHDACIDAIHKLAGKEGE